MDALRENDIEIARATSPEEKLRQPEQIEEMVQQWLESDE
jgi:hypothetical protein